MYRNVRRSFPLLTVAARNQVRLAILRAKYVP
jgi:hypothetical protein